MIEREKERVAPHRIYEAGEPRRIPVMQNIKEDYVYYYAHFSLHFGTHNLDKSLYKLSL